MRIIRKDCWCELSFRICGYTSNAVDCLVDSISNKLDNKYKCLTVSIDLKKAFDALDNGILLKTYLILVSEEYHLIHYIAI